MDTSKDRATGLEGGTSIRLRYSRQFQSGGHTHNIEAETALAVGASQERREQVIRELETGVEQLARQIVQRGSRLTDEARGPGRASAASGPIPMATNRTAELASASPPNTRTPVSESMPTTPAPSGERTIRLADFINVIKKYWEMSPQEAMKLLKVKSLDGLNYREAFNSLKAIKDAEGVSTPARAPQTQPGVTRPVVEAPRQPGRGTPPQTTSRPPTNQAPNTQGQAALKEVARPAPPTLPTATSTSEPELREEQRHEPRAGIDFAGSPKAPIPIQLGVVRDVAARNTYKFEEEEEEELELPEDDEEFELPVANSAVSAKVRSKLDELKEKRGNTAASAERLNVLKNVMDGQISEEQLQRIIQGVWNINTRRRLKNEQVEALVSWAKEDYFAQEAEELLTLLEEGEE